MSVYQRISEVGQKYIQKHKLFKWGFNLSPMYRRSTGKVMSVSEDLLSIEVKIPLSFKNRNYVNSIFGGSLFSAVDPIPMVQLMNLIGNDYVVWDKSAVIQFRRPAKQDVYARFTYTEKELAEIILKVKEQKEIEIEKETLITDQSQSKVFCIVTKTIYIADKSFFKEKRKRRKID